MTFTWLRAFHVACVLALMGLGSAAIGQQTTDSAAPQGSVSPDTAVRASSQPLGSPVMDTAVLNERLPEIVIGEAADRSVVFRPTVPTKPVSLQKRAAPFPEPNRAAVEAAPNLPRRSKLIQLEESPASDVVAAGDVPDVIADPLGRRERPDWLERDPQTNENGFRELTVVTSLKMTPAEARKELNAVIRKRITQEAQDRFQSDMDEIPLSNHSIHDQLVKETYIEEINSEAAAATVYRAHAMLVLDHGFDARIENAAREAARSHRVFYIGAGLASMLTMLGAVWGGLKLASGKPTEA
ncbi:MAG: hypothetical protein N2C14_27005 [Planctomycetales bacterium]